MVANDEGIEVNELSLVGVAIVGSREQRSNDVKESIESIA